MRRRRARRRRAPLVGDCRDGRTGVLEPQWRARPRARVGGQSGGAAGFRPADGSGGRPGWERAARRKRGPGAIWRGSRQALRRSAAGPFAPWRLCGVGPSLPLRRSLSRLAGSLSCSCRAAPKKMTGSLFESKNHHTQHNLMHSLLYRKYCVASNLFQICKYSLFTDECIHLHCNQKIVLKSRS